MVKFNLWIGKKNYSLESGREMKEKYLINEDGVILNTIKEGDKVKIVRKETLDFIKSEDDLIEINKGEPFIKIYPNVIDCLLNEDLSSADYKIIFICMKYLRYDSGAVMYENNGNFLSQKDIIALTKLGKKTVYNSIEKLVSKKILHKGVTGKEYQLFMNPFIFMRGTKVNKTLCSMFAKSKWNKNKRHQKPKN